MAQLFPLNTRNMKLETSYLKLRSATQLSLDKASKAFLSSRPLSLPVKPPPRAFRLSVIQDERFAPAQGKKSSPMIRVNSSLLVVDDSTPLMSNLHRPDFQNRQAFQVVDFQRLSRSVKARQGSSRSSSSSLGVKPSLLICIHLVPSVPKKFSFTSCPLASWRLCSFALSIKKLTQRF